MQVIQDYYPTHCEHCHRALPPTARPGAPRRHQVFELPPVRLAVTEHRRHGCRCPHCARLTYAPLPPGVPTGCLGPHLVVFLGLLTGIHRVSRRGAAELLAQWTGEKFSVGVLSAREGDLTAALAPAYAEVQRQVRADPVCHSDETAWWEQGKRLWCWLLRGKSGIFYQILGSRSRAAWETVLGRATPPAEAEGGGPPPAEEPRAAQIRISDR